VAPDSKPTKPPLRKAVDITNDLHFKPGYLAIVQGPTSDQEALFNIFAPRLKKYVYEAVDATGTSLTVNKYDSVAGTGFYNVDKIKVSGLALGQKYTLRVMDGKTFVDQRTFSALDIHKKNPNFALISCIADDYRFNEVIDPMWERLQNEKPDFLILNGDSVYVDSFEFVERTKGTESDLWQRYVDTVRRIPLYHWLELVPIFSTWDDHDYGTNDGDRTFVSKDAALKIFHAVFGGAELPGVWVEGPAGVSSVLHAFGQSFYFMDDRTFRQPNKNQTEQEPFGHWGQTQHEWLLSNLTTQGTPAWVINGNQCFNGKDLPFKENFEANHPKEFVDFIDQLKQVPSPVVFGSGDVHLSEIMRVPKERIGYETFELTSSAMHSYAGEGWDNPMRLEGAFTPEFNFMMIQSQNVNNSLQIQVKCLGLAEAPYFEKSLLVQRS
jgi:phosphodiesterase/alkaline phosphatase D-like protein